MMGKYIVCGTSIILFSVLLTGLAKEYLVTILDNFLQVSIKTYVVCTH